MSDPTSPGDANAKVEAARTALHDMCTGRRRFHMSIPVREDDTDLVLAHGIEAALALGAQQEQARIRARLEAVPSYDVAAGRDGRIELTQYRLARDFTAGDYVRLADAIRATEPEETP